MVLASPPAPSVFFIQRDTGGTGGDDSTEREAGVCGDSKLNAGEECDDGNNGPEDGCSPWCLREFCGDGILQERMGEQCDNGSVCSQNDLLPCRSDNDCVACMTLADVDVTRCGGDPYGKLCSSDADCRASPFVCSYNVNYDTDCTRLCRIRSAIALQGTTAEPISSQPVPVEGYVAACGNGVIDAGEICDDGNFNSAETPNACRTSCTLPVCGDGVTDTAFGEVCDQGVYNSDSLPDSCRMSCTLPFCGDGVQDSGEDCDDANFYSGDGCSIDCRWEWLPVCGNFILDPNEECDDGNILPGDGCDSLCRSELALPVTIEVLCGNGVTDADEECDDGNSIPGDGCAADCTIEPVLAMVPVCGDGILEAEEECDEGEANANTAGARCRPDCLRARCGDHIWDISEDCDDGNAEDLDGCSATCKRERPAAPDYSSLLAASINFPWWQYYTAFPYHFAPPATPLSDTGPATVAIMAAGAGAGFTWMRRRKKQ